MRILLIKVHRDTLNAFCTNGRACKGENNVNTNASQESTFACHVRASNQTDFGDAGNIETIIYDCSLQSTDGLQLPQLK